MSSWVNPMVEELPPSGIRKFFDIVQEMDDAISLGVGEPDFVTPWRMREAVIWSLEQGDTHYTSNMGLAELRAAIARYMGSRFGLNYDPKKEVLITVGASQGIDLAMRAVLRPGDEVLVPEPSYVSYAPCVTLAGGKPVGVPTGAEQGFRLTAEAVAGAVTPRTRAILLSYPNNPTGAIMEREDYEAIAPILRDHDLLVISDEIYGELTYTGRRHVSIAELPDMMERTLVLSGFSKSFAMTGWRVGYACGPADIIAAMLKITQYTMLCAPTMGQRAALEGLVFGMEDNFSEVESMRRAYNRRRRVVVSGLNAIGLTCFEPLGAFYAFPSVAVTGMSSENFCSALLREEKVAVVPGTAFSAAGEGFVRVSYASSMAHLREALERMAHFVSRHKKEGP